MHDFELGSPEEPHGKIMATTDTSKTNLEEQKLMVHLFMHHAGNTLADLIASLLLSSCWHHSKPTGIKLSAKSKQIWGGGRVKT